MILQCYFLFFRSYFFCFHTCCLIRFIYVAEKTCPLYAPPKNGALVCNYIGADPSCQVQCKQGFDFVFTPPFTYYCSGGVWKHFSIGPYDDRLPWPDCASKCDEFLIPCIRTSMCDHLS